MTLPQHAARWQHHKQPRASHKPTDPTDTTPHPGTVAACPICMHEGEK